MLLQLVKQREEDSTALKSAKKEKGKQSLTTPSLDASRHRSKCEHGGSQH